MTDYTVPLFINGEELQSATSYDIISPSTSKPIWRASSASLQDAHNAVTSAQTAFPAWRRLNPTKRRDFLLKACDIMERRQDEFASYVRDEVGGVPEFAIGSVLAAMQTMKDFACRLSSIVAEAPTCADDGQSAIVFKEPYGVVLAILPWNSPYSVAIQSMVAALATGNTVVMKASEFSPRCFWAVGSMFQEAGLPKGVLNIIQVQPKDAAAVTTALIEHKDVKKITFTGSANVGSIIASQCGKVLKPCVMELGGKASAIVLEDADLQKAAVQCAIGSFIHGGQICMSTTRIVVHKSVAQAFAETFKAVTDNIFGSAPSMSMINPAGASKAKALVQDAVDKGARLIYGDLKAQLESETRLRPMILEGVTPEMRLYNEESFGPEVALFAVENEEEAAQIANDSDYGLAAAVFTEDLKKGLRMSRLIESGNVCINSTTLHDEANLPRGGVKRSGFGRVNAREGMEEFLWPKSVTWQND